MESNQLRFKKQIVLAFFETFIERFILEDLKVLQSIQPDTITGLGGCTIPTAMAVISAIDLIGFLLNEKGDTKKSGENISYFINYNIMDLFPKYYNSDVVDKIYNYRHGMMHHFFPKFKGNFSGICKNENEKSLFISHLIDNQTEESLNITVLTNDFIKAVERLKLFLENTNDESIFNTIIKGLKGLEYYLPISSTIINCTTVNPGTPKNK
jgi:hypothetical protein